jgi:DNA-binding transcriptional LysR family regulator
MKLLPAYKDMHIYMSVVDKGSFTKVANSTGLSKSAVSKIINSLEVAWGRQLLNRTTRSIKTTAMGDYIGS